MPRSAAAPKAKEALATHKSERPPTPETADTNEEVRRAEATEPESDVEAEKKQRKTGGEKIKRSKSNPKEVGTAKEKVVAATKAAANPKSRSKAVKEPTTTEAESADEVSNSVSVPAPAAKATKGVKKAEQSETGGDVGVTKGKKRQADPEAAAGATVKAPKKRRGSDSNPSEGTAAAPASRTTKKEKDASKAGEKKEMTEEKDLPTTGASEATAAEGAAPKRIKKTKSTSDAIQTGGETAAPTTTKGSKKAAASSKAVAADVPSAEDATKTTAPSKANPKRMARKASAGSVEIPVGEGSAAAVSAPKAKKAATAKQQKDGVDAPPAAKPKRAARKGSVSSVEDGTKSMGDSMSDANKTQPKKAAGVVEEPKKGGRRKSVGSVVDSEASSAIEKVTKKKSGTAPKVTAGEDGGGDDGAVKQRKRAAPKTKSMDEKSSEMTTEEPAPKKKRAAKKADDEEKEGAAAEKKSKKRPNAEASPAVKKAKYDAHVDGKGPALDDMWKEQINEVPSSEDQLKIATWNVNGIRSVMRKMKNVPSEEFEGDLQAYLATEKPDILCLNEVKADDEVFNELMEKVPGYHAEAVDSEKKGYAGVAILVRTDNGLHDKVEAKVEGIGEDEHDNEGRTLTLVFPGCCVVASYVANAGQALKRLDYRTEKYDKALHSFLRGLQEKYQRPVVWCGDLNVAYEEIDIWDSKHNLKSAGHTPQERASFGTFLESGDWIDIWRKQNPNVRRYTYWPTRSAKSRVDNLGWRLDYFIITKELETAVTGIHIRDKFKGSDHCPVLLTVKKAALFDKP